MGSTISNQITIHKLRYTLPIISIGELCKTYPNNIYVLLGDIAIDATEFVEFHPGGKSAILNRHMCDITRDYEFHSANGKHKILAYARWIIVIIFSILICHIE